ncbi:MerR family transcriptional regulator [Lysobacter sp. D1-1-M9]|uniref:MerR family transcriptional regulator n=1 Tax=Novilysobacter longmucuonensis TaxID=3098603 RepID=UPI002FC5B599
MIGMSISALAKQGGVGVETIRYYQRRGLLQAPPRPSSGEARAGMRRYGEGDLRRLRFIRAAQVAGFTLDEIGELLDLDATRDRSRVHVLATQRVAALDAKIDDLQRARNALSRLAGRCGAPDAGPCPILDAFDPR